MNIHRIIILFSPLIFLIISCYARKEGCLDSLADNYNVTYDDACASCCTYPALQINIQHKAGDSTFRTQDTLVNDFGQKYRLTDIRYYLSSFDVYNQTYGKLHVLEMLTNSDKTVTIPDDVKICRYADQSLNIGTIKAYGQFDSISFYLGLPENIRTTEFINLSANHPLLNINKLKNDSGQIAHLTLTLERFHQVNDTLMLLDKVNIQLCDELLAYKFTSGKPFTTVKGEKPAFTVTADYLRLFQDIDLRDSVSVLQSNLKKNFNKFIFVE